MLTSLLSSGSPSSSKTRRRWRGAVGFDFYLSSLMVLPLHSTKVRLSQCHLLDEKGTSLMRPSHSSLTKMVFNHSSNYFTLVVIVLRPAYRARSVNPKDRSARAPTGPPSTATARRKCGQQHPDGPGFEEPAQGRRGAREPAAPPTALLGRALLTPLCALIHFRARLGSGKEA